MNTFTPEHVEEEKFQISSTKFQINPKLQIPNTGNAKLNPPQPVSVIGFSNLKLIWNLGFGYWDLDFHTL